MDRKTIPIATFREILNKNKELHCLDEETNLRMENDVEEEIFIFRFDDMRFFHALSLLGKNPSRLGFDIGYYLNGVEYLLGKLPYYPYISVDFGPSDLRRRASEDFGVGLSSLFMVDSFAVEWQNISQIPKNKKLNNFTPDFVAFSGNTKYIFESKGTTQPQKVSELMNKAIEQKKCSGEETEASFGFVSYFPNSKKIFPSFMFIADPPFTGKFRFLGTWGTIMLHYKNVLEFSHFERTLPAFLGVIRQKILAESYKEEKMRPNANNKELKYKKELEKLRTMTAEMRKLFEGESKQLTRQIFEEKEFIGYQKKIKMEEQSLSLFLGVESSIIETIINLNAKAKFLKNTLLEEKRRRVSVFSDGTIFQAVIE
jgi:hypothetical protein